MAPIDTTPEIEHIPLCVPEIRGNEWEYVKECLDTNWVSSAGQYVDQFEEAIAEYVGVDHAVACVNGTSALHLALKVAGVQPGTEVLVSNLTFIAPANAVRYLGAHPVFVDADPQTWQMNPTLVAEFLEERCRRNKEGEVVNCETGRTISALLPVHIFGHPADMDPICEVADQMGIPVVEDAAESLGARYKENPVGSVGTIGCFSFNGNKMITTGGGGMLVTSDEKLAEKARYLSTQAKDDPDEYIHREVGYNYRLTNIQAALGCAQLEKLDEYVGTKREIARCYEDAFEGLERLNPMPSASWAYHTRWFYPVVIEGEGETKHRELARHLEDAAIESRPIWQPMHSSPAHEGNQVLGGDVAEKLRRQVLCLPCSVGLTEREQQRVTDEIIRFFESN